ncbi:DUF559 domain-containing protein [Rothia sp. 32237D007AR]
MVLERLRLLCKSCPMHDRIEGLAAKVKTSQQLNLEGLSKNLIGAMHRRGELIRLTRGLYISAAESRQFMPEERCIAVTLALATSHRQAVLSHASAALVWGAPLFRLPTRVELSLPRSNHRHHRQVRYHSSRPEVCEVAYEVAGFSVTDPLTTVLDCARTLPVVQALAITDYFLHRAQVSYHDVRAQLISVSGYGTSSFPLIAESMSALTESPLESLAMFRIVQSNLERPCQQLEIRTHDGRVYRSDFAWESLKLLLEVDGLHKYYGAYRPVEEQLRRDTLRQRSLELMGWTVVRATWDDLMNRPQAVIHCLMRGGVRRIEK